MNHDHESLKELIRTEPTIASTFAEIDAEFAAVMTNATALWGKRSELHAQLRAIAEAKAEVAANPAAGPDLAAESPAETAPEVDREESPVLHENVGEAKDRISRMRSIEKLQEVVDTDQRSSVVEAAEKRLLELGES